MQNEDKNINESVLINNLRKDMYEEFFYGYYSNRRRVYWLNFVRGVFFGLGTFLSGTVVIALIVWLLSQFVTIPGIGDFIKQVLTAIQKA